MDWLSDLSIDWLIDWLIFYWCLFCLHLRLIWARLCFWYFRLLYPILSGILPCFLGRFFVLELLLCFGNDWLIDWSIVSIPFAHVTYSLEILIDVFLLFLLQTNGMRSRKKHSQSGWTSTWKRWVRSVYVRGCFYVPPKEQVRTYEKRVREFCCFCCFAHWFVWVFFLLLSHRCLRLFVVAHIRWDSLVIFICFCWQKTLSKSGWQISLSMKSNIWLKAFLFFSGNNQLRGQ